MASCPSLCEIESDDIKQIGFILSPEGEVVTKALFYSDYIRRSVLQAEAELMKEGIRVVQGNAIKDVIHDRRALRCHAGTEDEESYGIPWKLGEKIRLAFVPQKIKETIAALK
ncbi:hypothetical protein NDU88_002039 [Pleurodeles waltl]|uniref:Uncharacterized protein n=1 Tax=Pleurodeles waltl TaxID=8319 RepID=A0AAV7W1C0_PLEWA|nr:hypothetical protein NDU88_002039 [Pleurodeles waltl]